MAPVPLWSSAGLPPDTKHRDCQNATPSKGPKICSPQIISGWTCLSRRVRGSHVPLSACCDLTSMLESINAHQRHGSNRDYPEAQCLHMPAVLISLIVCPLYCASHSPSTRRRRRSSFHRPVCFENQLHWLQVSPISHVLESEAHIPMLTPSIQSSGSTCTPAC